MTELALISRDDLHSFEERGLSIIMPSTHKLGFIVVKFRDTVACVSGTNRAGTMRTTRRRYWFFIQTYGTDGEPQIMRDADIPDLHSFHNGSNTQQALENLLMAHREAVRSFLGNEGPTTRGSTFMTEVLPQIVAANLMPPVDPWTRDGITAVFASGNYDAAAPIVRFQLNALVKSGDLDFSRQAKVRLSKLVRSATELGHAQLIDHACALAK